MEGYALEFLGDSLQAAKTHLSNAEGEMKLLKDKLYRIENEVKDELDKLISLRKAINIGGSADVIDLLKQKVSTGERFLCRSEAEAGSLVKYISKQDEINNKLSEKVKGIDILIKQLEGLK